MPSKPLVKSAFSTESILSEKFLTGNWNIIAPSLSFALRDVALQT